MENKDLTQTEKELLARERKNGTDADSLYSGYCSQFNK